MKNLVMGVATGYDWYKLETFVNSVKNKSGRPALFMTARKTESVTPSIGARAVKSFGKLSQIIYLF